MRRLDEVPIEARAHADELPARCRIAEETHIEEPMPEREPRTARGIDAFGLGDIGFDDGNEIAKGEIASEEQTEVVAVERCEA